MGSRPAGSDRVGGRAAVADRESQCSGEQEHDQAAASVDDAAEGDALIAPSITARLLAGFADSATSSERAQPLVPLTDREEEVAVTVARGRTNAEIAAELHISLSTVKFHLGSLMTKIGARNRVQIAIWACETRRVRP